jgi:hypothetical protein
VAATVAIPEEPVVAAQASTMIPSKHSGADESAAVTSQIAATTRVLQAEQAVVSEQRATTVIAGDVLFPPTSDLLATLADANRPVRALNAE